MSILIEVRSEPVQCFQTKIAVESRFLALRVPHRAVGIIDIPDKCTDQADLIVSAPSKKPTKAPLYQFGRQGVDQDVLKITKHVVFHYLGLLDFTRFNRHLLRSKLN
ncbi:MAG: hypothetical protein ACKVIH_13920, partial [Burkholderiales bacterium]